MIDEDDYIDEYCFVTSVYHHCAKKQYILEAYHNFVVNHLSLLLRVMPPTPKEQNAPPPHTHSLVSAMACA